MINEIVSSISFFGAFLTAVAYFAALKLREKTKLDVLNPLCVSCILIITLILFTGIDHNVFIYGKELDDGTFDGTGSVVFKNLLTPATICLAIPLYEKISYLKKYPTAIFAGAISGTICALTNVLAIALMFGLNREEYVTLLPKSITTAIGIGVSSELGGIVPVTAVTIAFTGIFGSVSVNYVKKLFRIKHPVAVGLACGTASHAIGTSKARELGEVEEAMSGLAIALCGIISALTIPLMANIPV